MICQHLSWNEGLLLHLHTSEYFDCFYFQCIRFFYCIPALSLVQTSKSGPFWAEWIQTSCQTLITFLHVSPPWRNSLLWWGLCMPGWSQELFVPLASCMVSWGKFVLDHRPDQLQFRKPLKRKGPETSPAAEVPGGVQGLVGELLVTLLDLKRHTRPCSCRGLKGDGSLPNESACVLWTWRRTLSFSFQSVVLQGLEWQRGSHCQHWVRLGLC